MENDNVNDNEKANEDKLLSYFLDESPVHINLKKIDSTTGKHTWVNGLLTRKINDRVWELDERKLGKIRVSIGEIYDVEGMR